MYHSSAKLHFPYKSKNPLQIIQLLVYSYLVINFCLLRIYIGYTPDYSPQGGAQIAVTFINDIHSGKPAEHGFHYDSVKLAIVTVLLILMIVSIIIQKEASQRSGYNYSNFDFQSLISKWPLEFF